MSVFCSALKSSKSDDYETPKDVIVRVSKYIQKDLRIWDPFYCNGLVANHWQELGYNIKHENIDFFTIKEYPSDTDIIVSNPPFSCYNKIIEKLLEWDRPFILLCTNQRLSSKYMRCFNGKNLQIIFAYDMKFVKDGVQSKDHSIIKMCWLCYKMNLPENIIFD